jgi:cellulose synthase/poly-beta-1,6-N-acetylglucosamine synthase-like glycosyltransferase
MDAGDRLELKRRLRFAAVAAIALVVLAGWSLLLGGAVARRLSPLLFVLANLVLFLDFFDLLLRLFLLHRHAAPGGAWRTSPTSCPIPQEPFTAAEVRDGLRPFAVVASVHNLPPEEMDWFLAAAAPYRDRLWLIDDASTDDTWARLQRAGVRALRCARNRNKPGAIRELLRALPPEIATVVVLDPDARILNRSREPVSDLERVLFAFQRSGMAALCPRLVLRHGSLLERLQALEYCLAFSLGRRSLGDHSITSGIAVYRRDALARLLEGHTLSIYAEDLKNAFLLLASDERIYYDGRLVVETEGKRTWRSWFSQRVGWFYGLLKVYREHIADAVRGVAVRDAGKRFSFFYQFVVYMGVFLLLFHPFKVWSLGFLTLSALTGIDMLLGTRWVPRAMAVDPGYIAIAYAKYLLLSVVSILLVAELGERRRLLPAAPAYFVYAMAQIVPATVGYLNWFSLRLTGHRIYRDHFQTEACIRRELGGARTP